MYIVLGCGVVWFSLDLSGFWFWGVLGFGGKKRVTGTLHITFACTFVH